MNKIVCHLQNLVAKSCSENKAMKYLPLKLEKSRDTIKDKFPTNEMFTLLIITLLIINYICITGITLIIILTMLLIINNKHSINAPT